MLKSCISIAIKIWLYNKHLIFIALIWPKSTKNEEIYDGQYSTIVCDLILLVVKK